MKYHIEKSEKYSLATITDKNSKTVTAYITIDTHRNKSLAEQALHQVYTDAILSGNKKCSRDEFLSAINLLGASVGVSIQNSVLTISLNSQQSKFGKLLTIVEEMLYTPTFSNKELVRIRAVVANELHEAKENSRAIAQEELLNTLYGKADRKYSYSSEDTKKCLSKVTPTDLKKFHKTTLELFWTCSIAGTDEDCKKFTKVVDRLKKGTGLKQIVPNHKQNEARKTAVLKNIPSRTNIDFSIGAPLPFTLHHPDFIPLSLGLNVLGKWGGFSGRLMSTVREKEGLTYGIYGHMSGFSGTEQGYWRIMTFFSPDKAMQGLTSTFREITKLYKKGISQEELTRFKTISETGQSLLMDSVQSQLSDLHIYHCHDFTLKEIRERKNQIASLTQKEVNVVIKKYFNPNTLTISGAGPTDSLHKDIEKFIKSVT
jgi:zinc protease